MLAIRVPLLSLLVVGHTLAGVSNSPFGTAGDFDLLQLARFWEGTYKASCGSYEDGNLTLHGLWPQYTAERAPGHLWPQYCNASALVASVLPEVSSSFEKEWKALAPRYPGGLAKHEWEKHGTCASHAVDEAETTQDVVAVQTEYFKASLKLMKRYPTPQALRDASKSSPKATMSLSELQEAFGGADHVALQCDRLGPGVGQLSMAIECFDKDLKARKTCPPSVLTSSYDNSCVYPTKLDTILVGIDCKQ